jgi:hypothetical protein
MWMKRAIFLLSTILVVFVAVLAVLVVHPVRTVKARHGCSNATLKGNYALVAPGAQYVNVQRGFSMLATFNGEEDFSGSNFNITSGGIPYPTPPTAPYSFSGSTYTVNPDCTCTLTVPAEGPFSVALTLNGTVVDTGGGEVLGTWYDPPDVVSGTFEMKKAAHHGCSDRRLSGEYGLVAPGASNSLIDVSFSMLATLDEEGDFTGSSFNADFGGSSFAANTFTTSYTVTSDCTWNLTIPKEYPYTGAVTLNGIVVGEGGEEVVGSWYEHTSQQISGTFDIKKLRDSD